MPTFKFPAPGFVRTSLVACAAVILAAISIPGIASGQGSPKNTQSANNSGGGAASIKPDEFIPTDKAAMFTKQRLFLEAHPQTRIESHKGDQRVYGQAFATGPSAIASADNFKNNHIQMFGAEPADLVPQVDFLNAGAGGVGGQNTVGLMHDPITGIPKITAVYYTQQRDGIPVYGTRLVVLTRNEVGNPVVLANPDVRPLGNFQVQGNAAKAPMSPAAARSIMDKFGRDIQFHSVERVIWAGLQGEEAEPRLADNSVVIINGYDEWRAITDATTGELLHEDHLICFGAPVNGTARGLATEGIGSEQCENEVPQVLPYMRVTSGANFAFTDASGNYTIDPGGATIDATLDGQFFDVDNFNLTDMSVSIPVSNPADMLFNDLNVDPLIRAQVNLYVESNRVRDFVLQYNPTYPSVSTEVNFPARANRTDNFCPGNAWYSSTEQSINFCQAGPSNPNTSWSSVVHHEYGHRLVNAAGSGQSQYGEGSGDVMSVLILDSNFLGWGFFNSCASSLRNADNDCDYVTSGCSTCGSAIHTCGQLLSGCVWETRNNLVLTNPGNYIDILAPLAINAMLVHTGTAITPQITIDYLTLDDDDASILNGTPHYAEINGGFTEHNMAGPALVVGLLTTPASSATFSGLAGGPFTPSSVSYTIENVEDFPLEYEVTVSVPWVDVSNEFGTIAPNSTVDVSLSMNEAAAALGNGVYNGLITITNLTNGDGNTFRPVTLEIGRVIYTATGVPQNIPDNNATGVTNTITVPDGFCLADVDVDVNIAHNSIGQLVVELQSPLGMTVRLHNRTGGTADNIVKVYNDGVVPVDGPGTLADFNGRYVGGQWKLKVSDNAAGTTGSITSWALRVVPSGPICAPIAQAQSITVPLTITSPVNLVGTTATNDPVGIYIISSLPGHGSLTDPNAALITTVPYTLTSNANTVLYKPTFGYQGPDTFAFHVNDTVLDSADADVDITVGGPQLVQNFNMDTNPGWTTEGQWAYGVPAGQSGDPSSGHTGANVYGYNLNGDYVNNMAEFKLTSTAIDLSNVSDVSIKFWRWLGVERAQYDHARFQVSNNGTTWTTIWENPVPSPSINEAVWSQHEYDLSTVADNQATVYLRWTMGTTDSSVLFHGWNLDDIELWGAIPICPTDIDGSGGTDIDDLLLVINNFGAAGGPADINGSGAVDIDDLLQVINGWGDCN